MQARHTKGLMVLVGLVVAAFAVTASADETAQAKARTGEITLRPIIIKERLPRPLAVVDVSRVTTHAAIPLRAFSPIDRIEGATRRAPF